MACIRKRRGKWVIDYRDVLGKRRWETVQGNRKDAEDRLAKILAGGKRVLDTKRKFKEFAEEWVETYARPHVKESTLTEYQSVFKNHLLPAFGSIPFSKITREMIKKLIAKKVKLRLSRSHVRNIIVPLREMFNYAIDDDNGVVLFNPGARIGQFNQWRDEDRKIDPLTREEITVLLKTAKEKLTLNYPLFF